MAGKARHQLNVRLDETLVRQLRTISEIEDTPMTDLVDEAIRTLVDQRMSSKTWMRRYEEWASRTRELLSSFEK